MSSITKLLIIIVVLFIFGGSLFLKHKSVLQINTRKEPGAYNTQKYTNYSDANLAQSQKRGISILFFSASWCPTCAVLDEEIVKRANEIPNNVTILKIDYDRNKKLKEKYSVVSQHTLIVLDKKRHEIKRWVGGGLDTLLQEISNI